MEIRMVSEVEFGAESFSFGERVLVWTVRLASLPFLFLAILLLALIYVTASLARQVLVMAVCGQRQRGLKRVLSYRSTPQDA